MSASDLPRSTAATDHEVTRLLLAWNQGNAAAAEELTELVYAQVRAIAGKHLRQFDGDVTLAPTELANELFLRLLGKEFDWRDRRHFFGVVVAAMRNLLIDMARARGSEKRGGGQNARDGLLGGHEGEGTCPPGQSDASGC